MKRSDSPPSQAPLSRRTVFAGAGTVGALAAAAAVLPRVDSPAAPERVRADAAEAGGYQETPHVKRYYQTARV